MKKFNTKISVLTLIALFCFSLVSVEYAHASEITDGMNGMQMASLLTTLQALVDNLKAQLSNQTKVATTFASTNAFAIGNRVQTTSNLNVRSKASTNPSSKVLCTQTAGA